MQLFVGSRRTVISGFEVAGKMLHVGKAAEVGHLLDLERLVGEECPGFLHAGF